MTVTQSDPAAEERRDALVGRLFEATLGAFDLLAIHLGDQLGLYRALAHEGPLTAPQLASLLALARAADPEPWRDRFRDPDAWRDGARLAALAKEVDVEQQPPTILACLGRRLASDGRRRRMSACASRSRSAVMTHSASGAAASTMPHGSTIRERPPDWWFGGWWPIWLAATWSMEMPARMSAPWVLRTRTPVRNVPPARPWSPAPSGPGVALR